MIGRADIEGSKSNVAMNAWLPQASSHIYQLQYYYYQSYTRHLRCCLTDVPPQPNSPSENSTQLPLPSDPVTSAGQVRVIVKKSVSYSDRDPLPDTAINPDESEIEEKRQCETRFLFQDVQLCLQFASSSLDLVNGVTLRSLDFLLPDSSPPHLPLPCPPFSLAPSPSASSGVDTPTPAFHANVANSVLASAGTKSAAGALLLPVRPQKAPSACPVRLPVHVLQVAPYNRFGNDISVGFCAAVVMPGASVWLVHHPGISTNTSLRNKELGSCEHNEARCRLQQAMQMRSFLFGVSIHADQLESRRDKSPSH
ncbi:hypothetical protein BLNAU_11736 [Blattamonas nauphoetae]|uniref:Uncharacterized protein n=1 Tax=Blattamonas nauphoetae TaxID=2049346 RepID=A0ABQ9XLG6_9EUKA|nr:hypothetical protein BLNAU_11736 [Blattamonas nauphoetae]